MFEIEGKTLDFKRVAAKDGLAIQALMGQSNGDSLTPEAMQKLAEIALRYLVITDGDKPPLESPTIDLLDSIFENPMIIVEITTRFMEKIGGFLAALPSFRNTK